MLPAGQEYFRAGDVAEILAAQLEHHARDFDRWLIDVSHNMDLPSPGLAKAQAARSKP